MVNIKYIRGSSCKREYEQAKRLLDTTLHFLITGYLLVFIKISLVPQILKIDNLIKNWLSSRFAVGLLVHTLSGSKSHEYTY